MKNVVSIISIISCLSFSVFSQQEDVIALKNEVKEAKKELKSSLDELSYDGTKVTYYQEKNEKDFKELEVVLFLRDNYTLFFSGEAASGMVKLRIFDKPSHDPDRIQLYEVRNISGKTREVTEEELNQKLSFYVHDGVPLRSVYVEYEVSKGRSNERGAIIMTLGYPK